MNRRTLLQLLGIGATGLATRGASWASTAPDPFFIVIHAGGGWDVTLWADPRNERRGLVEPPSSANTSSGLRHWRPAPLGGGAKTFEILEPPNTSLRLGPAIGDLYDLRDRLTIINGIATNTVSHAEGVTLAVTGRARNGGMAAASSVDVLLAHELGAAQFLPDVTIRFPTSFVGDKLDKRVVPTQITHVDAIAKTLSRSSQYFQLEDRDNITAVLSEEARELAGRGRYRGSYEALASQYSQARQMLTDDFRSIFDVAALRAKYPDFDLQGRTGDTAALGAAFAVEAIARNLVRCVAFSLGGLDTHDGSHMAHGLTLQDHFTVVANLVKQLDATPHPLRPSSPVSDHTHILIVSEFCRTPQINLQGGRDHYPNNSALVISPRFRGGRAFGETDIDQLLPVPTRAFVDGVRAIAPADVIATFLGAVGIDPRKHLRDGEVMREMLV